MFFLSDGGLVVLKKMDFRGALACGLKFLVLPVWIAVSSARAVSVDGEAFRGALEGGPQRAAFVQQVFRQQSRVISETNAFVIAWLHIQEKDGVGALGLWPPPGAEARLELLRAHALEISGDLVGAEVALRRIGLQDPLAPLAFRARIRLRLSREDFSGAASDAVEYLARHSEDRVAQVALAFARLALGDPSLALQTLLKAPAGRTEEERSRYFQYLGLIEESVGHPGPALDALRAAQACAPDDPWIAAKISDLRRRWPALTGEDVSTWWSSRIRSVELFEPLMEAQFRLLTETAEKALGQRDFRRAWDTALQLEAGARLDQLPSVRLLQARIALGVGDLDSAANGYASAKSRGPSQLSPLAVSRFEEDLRRLRAQETERERELHRLGLGQEPVRQFLSRLCKHWSFDETLPDVNDWLADFQMELPWLPQEVVRPSAKPLASAWLPVRRIKKFEDRVLYREEYFYDAQARPMLMRGRDAEGRWILEETWQYDATPALTNRKIRFAAGGEQNTSVFRFWVTNQAGEVIEGTNEVTRQGERIVQTRMQISNVTEVRTADGRSVFRKIAYVNGNAAGERWEEDGIDVGREVRLYASPERREQEILRIEIRDPLNQVLERRELTPLGASRRWDRILRDGRRMETWIEESDPSGTGKIPGPPEPPSAQEIPGRRP